jgi:hypothetical protein
MMKRSMVVCALSALGALGLVGCGSDREVAVTGSVSAPASTTVSGPILLEFSDVVDAEAQPKSVLTSRLDALGSFTETVSVEGDKVRVRAVVDTDGDGACSAGELWAESDATIKDDDTVDPVTLTLGHEPCPAME